MNPFFKAELMRSKGAEIGIGSLFYQKSKEQAEAEQKKKIEELKRKWQILKK